MKLFPRERLFKNSSRTIYFRQKPHAEPVCRTGPARLVLGPAIWCFFSSPESPVKPSWGASAHQGRWSEAVVAVPRPLSTDTHWGLLTGASRGVPSFIMDGDTEPGAGGLDIPCSSGMSCGRDVHGRGALWSVVQGHARKLRFKPRPTRQSG